MNWLNYHHLYYFYVIAQEGSVTKATKKLRLAQSTLSTQLKQFEDVIGHELFERKGKSIFLTDMGRQVLEYAHEIFSLGQELKDSLSDRDKLGIVKVQIGIMDSIPKSISEALLDYIFSLGNVSVRLEEGSEESLLEKLEEHDIDLLISDRKPEMKKNRRLIFKELLEMAYYFGAHRNLNFETFEQATNHGDFVFRLPYDPGLDIYEAALAEGKANSRVLAELHDAEIHQRLIKSGKAVGAIPESAFKEASSLVRLNPKPAFKEVLWMVSARRKLQNPIAQKVWNNFPMSDKML